METDNQETLQQIEETVDAVLEDSGSQLTEELLTSIQESVSHPLLTTEFQDYTVLEGLLLLLVLLMVIRWAFDF